MTTTKQTRDALVDAYLSYVNDYLTVERFAADHDLSVEHAIALIDMGRSIALMRATTPSLPDGYTLSSVSDGHWFITPDGRDGHVHENKAGAIRAARKHHDLVTTSHKTEGE